MSRPKQIPASTNGSFFMVLKSSFNSMRRVEKIIAKAILDNPQDILEMTIAQFAKSIEVADSSIVRFCRDFGFDGYIQLKIKLAMELKGPEEIIFEDLKKNDDEKTILSKVFAANIHTLEETLKGLEINDIIKVIDILCKAKKILFFGIGSSAPIARDAYYRFMRIGFPAISETDHHIASIMANMFDKDCAVIGISHSGRTRSTIMVLEAAKASGASAIAITSNMGSPITKIADISLLVLSEESKYMKEAITARLGHLAILDSILACIAMRSPARSIKKTEEFIIQLNKLREN